MELIQEFTQPVLASDTDNGVTVTIEAVLGDSERSFLLCRMERTDGQPVLPEETTSSANPYRYQSYSFETASFQGTLGSSDAAPHRLLRPVGGWYKFLTASSDGGSLYFFFDFLWNDGRFPVGEITLPAERPGYHLFPMVPKGEKRQSQRFRRPCWWKGVGSSPSPSPRKPRAPASNWPTAKPSTRYRSSPTTVGTCRACACLPFFLTMEYTYTADEAAVAEATASYAPASQLSLEEWVSWPLTNTFMDTPSYLTPYRRHQAYPPAVGRAERRWHKTGPIHFVRLLPKDPPLDTVESLTIGDLTIPVS